MMCHYTEPPLAILIVYILCFSNAHILLIVRMTFNEYVFVENECAYTGIFVMHRANEYSKVLLLFQRVQ